MVFEIGNLGFWRFKLIELESCNKLLALYLRHSYEKKQQQPCKSGRDRLVDNMNASEIKSITVRGYSFHFSVSKAVFGSKFLVSTPILFQDDGSFFYYLFIIYKAILS